jgi:alpha-aminoadipic semialdehyde synthase
MIDSLWALGQRLAWTGIPTPFSHVRPTLQYDGLEQAQAAIREIGQQIQSQGLPPSLVPLVCGFAGYGNVSRGAQEIYDLLPLVEVAPEDLHKLKDKDTHHVYKVVFKEEHMVEPIHSDARFDLQDYYHHPEKYRSKFESYLPHLTMLINGIYWSEQYPRLVTKRYLEKVFDQETMPRLQVIGDISCDVEGAIECNLHATTPGDPIYVYDPMTEQTTSGYEGRGVVVLAVDNLPAELPKESSTHFSRTLMPLVPEIVQADYTVPFHKAEISPPLKHAIIVWQGGLTPDYRYLEEFL